MAVTTIPPVPRDLRFIFRWLENLRVWLHSFTQTPEVNHIVFKVWHAEPEKVTDGMVVAADGFDWDPGEGFGLYIYSASAEAWYSIDKTAMSP